MIDLTIAPILLLPDLSTPNPLHTHLALRRKPTYADIPLLCLGMQQPLNPASLHSGEYPACATMTTGYVFRVENEATVAFL